MKLMKIVMLAAVFAFVASGVALAAGSVQMNQTVTVSADVKNTTNNGIRAAVKMAAYDKVGTAVGHLCKEVYLAANRVTTVNYLWQAPGYETGLYWSPKVEIGGSCVNATDGSSHDSDDTDSDSDDHHDSH